MRRIAGKNDTSVQDDSYSPILKLAKGGKTKSEIARELSLSTQQLRRLTAELVDQGFLHVDSESHSLTTTDRGLAFLQQKAKK